MDLRDLLENGRKYQYKKRSLSFSSNVEENRTLRYMRKSIEWQAERGARFNQRRNINPGNAEVVEGGNSSCDIVRENVVPGEGMNAKGQEKGRAQDSKIPKATVNSRKLKLEKWKQEKIEKKNLEKLKLLKEKPVFKVGVVHHDLAPKFPTGGRGVKKNDSVHVGSSATSSLLQNTRVTRSAAATAQKLNSQTQKQNQVPRSKQRGTLATGSTGVIAIPTFPENFTFKPPKGVKPLDMKMQNNERKATSAVDMFQLPSTSGRNLRGENKIKGARTESTISSNVRVTRSQSKAKAGDETTTHSQLPILRDQGKMTSRSNKNYNSADNEVPRRALRKRSFIAENALPKIIEHPSPPPDVRFVAHRSPQWKENPLNSKVSRAILTSVCEERANLSVSSELANLQLQERSSPVKGRDPEASDVRMMESACQNADPQKSVEQNLEVPEQTAIYRTPELKHEISKDKSASCVSDLKKFPCENSPNIIVARRRTPKTRLLSTLNKYDNEDKEKQENDTSTIKQADPKQEQWQSADENEKDVHYFRKLVKDESVRLLEQSREWVEMKPSVPSEIQDLIDSYNGQTNLFIRERFKQFEGLITNCERGEGEKLTTCTDLQGFWDMIYAQVQDLDKKFSHLRDLKANNWKEKEVTVNLKRANKKVTQPKKNDRFKNVKSNIRDLIRANRQKQKQNADPVPEEAKVFDGGFFRIDSPVRKSDTGLGRGRISLLNQALQISVTSATPPTSETKTVCQSEISTPITRGGSACKKSILKQTNGKLKSATESDTAGQRKKVLFAEDVIDNSPQPEPEPLSPITPCRKLLKRRSSGSFNVTPILKASLIGRSVSKSPLMECNGKEFQSPASIYQSIDETLKHSIIEEDLLLVENGEEKTVKEGVLLLSCNENDTVGNKENHPFKVLNSAATDIELDVKVSPLQRTYGQNKMAESRSRNPFDDLVASQSQKTDATLQTPEPQVKKRRSSSSKARFSGSTPKISLLPGMDDPRNSCDPLPSGDLISWDSPTCDKVQPPVRRRSTRLSLMSK